MYTKEELKAAGIAGEMREEALRAMKKHAPLNSAHEGYAVIAEELDELWDEVKAKKLDWEKAREEVIQIGAMALRFVYDLEGKYKTTTAVLYEKIPQRHEPTPEPLYGIEDY